MLRFAVLAAAVVVALTSCNGRRKMKPEEFAKYKAEVDAWHAKRIKDVLAPNGWVNLIGLYWLEPGIHSFGSGEKSDIVFPAGTVPEKAGFFLVNDGQVTITVEDGVDIRADGKPIARALIFHPDSVKNPQLELGSVRWNVILRSDQLGIRLRDLESTAVKNFKGIERFPVNPEWKREARFEKYDSLKTISITNIIGQTTEQRALGALVFEWQGQQLRLDVLEGRDDFFIVFADATSGKQTYGGGRFIDVKKPDSTRITIIDFNKAYNPPCVFSPFATCPLPPPQNRLPIEVKAGELNYHYDDQHLTATAN
ncbi:MAG: DUF1684 domain-containing protein [Cytophagales bacterium]